MASTDLATLFVSLKPKGAIAVAERDLVALAQGAQWRSTVRSRSGVRTTAYHTLRQSATDRALCAAGEREPLEYSYTYSEVPLTARALDEINALVAKRDADRRDEGIDAEYADDLRVHVGREAYFEDDLGYWVEYADGPEYACGADMVRIEYDDDMDDAVPFATVAYASIIIDAAGAPQYPNDYDRI